MEVLIAIVSAVFSSYTVSPDLYSHGPYEYEAEYSSVEECQIDSYGVDAICTTEAPYQMYVLSNRTINHSGKALEYVDCDYWAGCYTQED